MAATSDSGVSNGKSYTVTITSITGGTPDGTGKWQVQASQLTGGDPAVAEAFNKASQASARALIANARDDDARTSWTFDPLAHMTFRNTAIAQIISGDRFLGAAPPTVYLTTIVIDSRTAQPITLADLFTNEQDGLNRLSDQIKILANMGPEPGNAPVPENFTNWIPTGEGMEIHFVPYQFQSVGRFNPTITVPWSALTDVLAPNMAVLAQG
jgi:hypothetical protein